MEDLWKINLNNTTNDVLSVYLFGTLSEDNAGLIATGTSSVFTLNPGMKVVNAHELTPISIEYPNPDIRYKESMIRTGGVPTGNYEVCVSVKISGSNEDVGSDCIDQSVQISSPVSLVTPDYGEKLFLQLPIFTWMHMKQPGSGAYYTLTIVEILSNQTPEIAIQTNLAWFTEDKINKTLLQYPISARGFKHGKEYAWKVDVYEKGSLLTESDVGLFKYNYEEKTKPDIIFPKVGEEIEVDAVSFEWLYNMQADNFFTIKVVEVLNDQSPEAAIQKNIAFWEMDNIQQTRIQYPETGQNFVVGKQYAWQVSVFDGETLLANSDVASFKISSIGISSVDIIFPKVGEEIEVDEMNFKWTYNAQADNTPSFSVKVVEVLDDQFLQSAIQENAAFWKMKDIQQTSVQYPETEQEFEAGKKYAWQVSVYQEGNLLAKSNVSTFIFGSKEGSQVDIIFPKVGEEIEVDEMNFEWTYNAQADNTPSFSIKVVEVLDGQSPQSAFQENAAFWEMKDIQQTSVQYPETEQEFEVGKKYAWQVSVFDGETILTKSDVQSFIIGLDKSSNLDIIFPKVGEEIEGDGLYFEWKNYYCPESIIVYSIKIVEVLETQTPETAMEVNECCVEKNSFETPTYLYYSDSSVKLDTGKKYAWQVKAYNESELLAESKLSTFKIIASLE